MSKKALKLTWFVYFLAFVETVVYLSFDMSLPALPSFVVEFNINEKLADYTVVLWSLGAGSIQLVFAPLAVKWGKKLTLLCGVFFFILATFTCAYTENLQLFFVSRFIQGATVCFIFVSGYALIHELYSTKDSISVLSLLSAITVIAPSLGPTAGAFIMFYRSWRDIFWLLFVLGIIGFIGLACSMQADKAKRNSEKSVIIDALQTYCKIFINIFYMRYGFIYAMSIAGIIIWNIKSPFIIIEHFQNTEIFYGIYQGLVFGAFIVGSFFAKYLNNIDKRKSILFLGLLICSIGNISLLVLVRLTNELLLFLPALIFYAFGTAMPLGLLNRYAIEASGESAGMKMAVLSTLVSVFVLFFHMLVVNFELGDLAGLSLLMLGITVVNISLYKLNISKIFAE